MDSFCHGSRGSGSASGGSSSSSINGQGQLLPQQHARPKPRRHAVRRGQDPVPANQTILTALSRVNGYGLDLRPPTRL